MKIVSNVLFFLLIITLLSSCVQPTKKQKVNFRVDANGIDNVQSIGVRGAVPPLNWNKSFLLEDPNRDLIYTGTLEFDLPYDFVELKFVKNSSDFELEGKDNRKLYFDKSQTTNFTVRFNEP